MELNEDLEPDVYRLGIAKPDQLLAHNERLELSEDRTVTIRLVDATVSGVVRNAQRSEVIAGALIRVRPTEGHGILDRRQVAMRMVASICFASFRGPTACRCAATISPVH
jgi:hypothetical protein